MRPIVNLPIEMYLRQLRRPTGALLARITADPERYQRRTLQRIVTANAATTYGRSERAEAHPALPGWSMPVDDLFPH